MTITIPIEVLWLLGGVLIGFGLSLVVVFYYQLFRNLF